MSGGTAGLRSAPLSSLDEVFKQQESVNAPEVDEMGGQANRDIDWRYAAVEQSDHDLVLHPEQLE